MSKEYRLQFNLNNYISAEEPYLNDIGAVILGVVDDDSGILKVLFDSHKTEHIKFFIELIKYVTDLETKLAEKEKEIESYKHFKITIGTMENNQVDISSTTYIDQDKISFCIEQLEKIKELCKNKFEWWENSEWEGNIYDKSDVSNAYFDIEANIDEQIKQLKEKE